jgi:low affinity Fe/Cu permease
MKDLFRKVSSRVSAVAGSAGAFSLALLIIVVWAVSGPLFGFSDTWQLVINTGTTIVTFLMVFLIQNTQNRDGKAMQLKLDELIRASKSARDSFVGTEGLTDEELAELDQEFKKIHEMQMASPAMHKLHDKIAAARQNRQTLRSQAGHMLNTLLKPGSKDR